MSYFIADRQVTLVESGHRDKSVFCIEASAILRPNSITADLSEQGLGCKVK